MNWLDRYIESVKRYLPERSRDDIGDELRSVLEEKMDDAKEASGGTLEAADELRILKEFGHPLKVASSYQEQQVLISEQLFPIYKTVIKYLLLILGTVYIASIVVEATGWVDDVNIGLETIGLWYFAIITLSFYLMDDYLRKVDFFARWDPKKLPPFDGAASRIDIGSTIVGIVCTLIWIWVLMAINRDHSWAAFTGQAENPMVSVILWVKVHAVLWLVLSVYQLFRSYWTPGARIFDAVTNFFAVFFLGFTLTVEEPHTRLVEVLNVAGDKDIHELGDTILRFGLGGALMVCLGFAGYSLYQVTRFRRSAGAV